MRGNKEPLIQQLGQFAADFIHSQSNKTSLITVTNTELDTTMQTVTFRVSVYPESAEKVAMGFLMRKRGDCKEYIKKHSKMKRVPHVEFVLDSGEKNRQRVDELLSQ